MNIIERIRSGNWPLLKILRLRFGRSYRKYDISKEEVFKLLEDDDTKVIDVRTSAEIEKQESLVEDAISIDYSDKDFLKKISKLPKDATYIVTWSGGIRARGACQKMTELGFERVYNLKGGLNIFNECGTWG